MRHRLSEADDGTVVSARSGDEIDLCLHAMPSGGYRWLLDDTPDDVLESLDQRFDFAEGRVGERNATHFRFRVKAVGRGLLRLRYARSWEPTEAPLKTFEATIVNATKQI